MKTNKRLTAFLLCLAFLLVLFYGLENRGQVNLLEGQLNDLKGKFEAQTKAYEEDVDSLSRQNAELQMQIDSMTAQLDNSAQKITELQDQLDHKMDLPLSDSSSKTNRGGERLTKTTMKATAYDLSFGSCGKRPNHPEYGIGANGQPVKEYYTVAAGKRYSFGTKIYIPYFSDWPNNGWFVCTDRGGAISDSCVDVYFGKSASTACKEFGVRYLDVYILEGI